MYLKKASDINEIQSIIFIKPVPVSDVVFV